jgi:bacterioferritin-associated ferredoxin
MADVICLCNQIWDEDLREEASICNKCMQCEELVQAEIYHARMKRQQNLR